MRSDDARSTVALDALMLPWFDLLLLCTKAHAHTPWPLAQRRELGARLPLYRCCCTAAAVLLYNVFEAARPSGCFSEKHTPLLLITSCACDSTYSNHTCTEAHTHTSIAHSCHESVLLLRRSRQQRS